MKKRILFIINPISGTKSKGSITTSIEKNLNKDIFNYEIKLTEYAGHAAEIATAAAQEGIDIVAAVGGDGTVNEVARALVHTNTALAIIPCGSGNGLARHLHIPLTPQKAIDVINKAVIRDLDYGKINGHPFFCTCGLGFDAFVSMKFAEGGKRGFISYIDKTLREGIKYKPETYTIEDENGTEIHKAFLIACANASQYGNNAYIAPQASMSDGLMDIIIMEPFNTIEAPQIILQLFNKSLPSNSHVKMFQARKIRITRPSDGAIHCDGDPIMTGKEIEVELIQKSFKVVVNPESKRKKMTFVNYFSEMSIDLLKKMGTIIELKDLKELTDKVISIKAKDFIELKDKVIAKKESDQKKK